MDDNLSKRGNDLVNSININHKSISSCGTDVPQYNEPQLKIMPNKGSLISQPNFHSNSETISAGPGDIYSSTIETNSNIITENDGTLNNIYGGGNFCNGTGAFSDASIGHLHVR